MTRALVLGGGGFLGRHLVRALAEQEQGVAAIDIAFADGARVSAADSRTMDLFGLSSIELAELIAPHDVIYHLAWSTVPASAEKAPEQDLTSNVGLAIRLMEAVRGTSKTMIFASSGGTVYGRSAADPIDEGQPLRPIGAYGAAKAAAEAYIGAFRSAYGVDIRVARLSNPFGAGQARMKLQGAVSRFANEALEGKALEVWGDGKVVRDYIHVLDVVDGLLCLAAVHQARVVDLPAINIAGGEGVSLNELVELLSGVLKRTIPVRYYPGRPFDVQRNVLDIAVASDRLGWRPSMTLYQGIERMIADLQRQPDCLFSSARGNDPRLVACAGRRSSAGRPDIAAEATDVAG